jgi:hypothetical protein
MSADGSQFFLGAFLSRKNKIKFWLASTKSMKILGTVTLFRGHVPAFRKAPVTLKVVTKAAFDPENCSESRP